MRLSKGVPLDPCAGFSPETRAWVDLCKLHYLKRLAFGGGIAGPELKQALREMGKNERVAKAKALEDFGRFAKHFDNNGISDRVGNDPQEHAKWLLAHCLEAELQRRDISLDTANAVFEATEAALTSKAPKGGRPIGKDTETILFLWSRLDADGLSNVSEAARVIAHVLRYYGDGSPPPTEGTIRVTIRNFEVLRR